MAALRKEREMAQTIDAHHHLWRYSETEYRWISDEMSVLKQHFLPTDLDRAMRDAAVDGAVVVQARQDLDETKWLLECAQSHAFIRGVVGWAPLLRNDIAEVLAGLVQAPKLKGLRHVVQEEPAGFLLREDFNRGILSLQGTGLVYDILIYERQLAEAVEFVHRHPEQRFVLDHLAKPKIRAGEIEPWRTYLRELAASGDIFCKISGIVTEAECSAWTLDGLRPYMDAALEAFGPERLMAGSDWPVCLLASEYTRWWDALREWLLPLSEADKALILGGTAEKVYRLS